jgi:hypothetical protein
MSSFPANGAPSFDALGDIVEQRLSGCTDAKATKTRESRLSNFLDFIKRNDLTASYLTTNPFEVDKIVSRYIVYILSGFGCTTKFIEANTVKEYLKEINKHYIANGFSPPWINIADTKTARLVRDKDKFEKEAERRSPLTDAVIDEMRMATKNPTVSITDLQSIMWDVVGLGRYTGNRIQEIGMDAPDKIKYYSTPDGLVMRAFSVDNILFKDSHGMPISTESALASPELVVQAGTRYDIQKNRVNGQVLWYHKDISNPDYCPVMRALSLVRRAVQLGQLPSDPLCVYIKNDKRVYLTDKVVTEYYRTVTQRVHPTITEEMLSLISTHSIRVTACILLAEAGKPMYFIKLRLRWLSNCFETYLRNTDRVAMQHLYAITPGTTAQSTVTKVPLVGENIDSEIVKEFGNVTLGDYELDDED